MARVGRENEGGEGVGVARGREDSQHGCTRGVRTGRICRDREGRWPFYCNCDHQFLFPTGPTSLVSATGTTGPTAPPDLLSPMSVVSRKRNTAIFIPEMNCCGWTFVKKPQDVRQRLQPSLWFS